MFLFYFVFVLFDLQSIFSDVQIHMFITMIVGCRRREGQINAFVCLFVCHWIEGRWHDQWEQNFDDEDDNEEEEEEENAATPSAGRKIGDRIIPEQPMMKVVTDKK